MTDSHGDNVSFFCRTIRPVEGFSTYKTYVTNSKTGQTVFTSHEKKTKGSLARFYKKLINTHVIRRV